MSIYGATANTPLGEIIAKSEEGEANGAVIYQTLALLAREQGYAEEAQIFSEIANMESHHSGFYAAMNAKYPQDFWQIVKNIQQAEENADSRMPEIIEKVRALGTEEALAAAEGMEFICAQERYHGQILKQLIARHEQKAQRSEFCQDEKHSQPPVEDRHENTGVKVYVCKVCGYEYVGNLDDEPDDYVCPLCHKGKEVFVEKEQ
ncbi:MAG: hypothetical protein J6M93_05450 [Succinivibrio sp.]|nr:hypothetical protein [Succinivibrio sp.]